MRRHVWGGRRLGTVLGKPIGDESDYAESWEVVDHGQDQSTVSAGSLAGTQLHELVRQRGDELLGRHHPLAQFPLLFKFLDTHTALSVQVHPDDEQASTLNPPDLGKTEAWVILERNEDSKVYAGLKRGFDREALTREVVRGTSHLCLHSLVPEAGDCQFIPARVVHALGAGLLVAEIQQSSDTTFRVFDWNRLGSEGKPRPLHIEQALETIDYDRGPIQPQVPQVTDRAHVRRLVACEKFILDRWEFETDDWVGGDERFHIIAVLDGSVWIDGDAAKRPLQKGDTALIPAASGKTKLSPEGRGVMLDVYLPLAD